MRYVSIHELRNNLADILESISLNNSVIITKHNKPKFRIQHYTDMKNSNPFLETYGLFKKSSKTGTALVKEKRYNSTEKKRMKKYRDRT